MHIYYFGEFQRIFKY